MRLSKRVITGIWGIPLIFFAIWFGTPWFTILIAIWGVLAAFEFYKMVASAKVAPLIYFGLVWTLLFILSPHCNYVLTVPLLLTSAVALPLLWLLLRPQKEDAFTRWAWTIAGILYVGWLLSYMVGLRNLDGGRDWIFMAIFTTFGSDTLAFVVGRALGKHRLAPHISPGKTWEGTIGGIIGAIIVSVILVTFLDLPLNYGQGILLGFLVSVFGQLGDLIESLLKRNMGVKDSGIPLPIRGGSLIPGHGGALDRMDSMLFAGIVVYFFAVL